MATKEIKLHKIWEEHEHGCNQCHVAVAGDSSRPLCPTGRRLLDDYKREHVKPVGYLGNVNGLGCDPDVY